MSKTATLKGKISLDDSEFSKVMRRATDRLKKFGSDSAEAVGKWSKRGFLALASGAAAAGGGLLYAAKAAADLGGQLSDASAVTGIAAGKMLVLQQAFANAGMSGESAVGAVARLQAVIGKSGIMSEEAEDQVAELTDRINELKRTGGSGTQIASMREQIAELKTEARGVQKAFQRLGLNQMSLSKMDGAQQLEAVLRSLSRMSSQTEKLAVLRMLRLPPELLTLAKDPKAFKSANTQLGGLVGNMDKFADKFDRISDIINAKPGIMIKQMSAGFLKALSNNPMVTAMLDHLEKLDLSSIGEKMGEYVSAAIDFAKATIQDGDISETISGLLKSGFSYAMEYLLIGMVGVMSLVGGAFKTIFSGKGREVISALTDSFIGAAVIMGHQFSKAMQLAMFDIDQYLQGTIIGKIYNRVKDAAGAVSAAGQTIMGGLSTGIIKFLKGDIGLSQIIDREPNTGIGPNGELGVMFDNANRDNTGFFDGAMWDITQQGYDKLGKRLNDLLFGRTENDPRVVATRRNALAGDQFIDFLGKDYKQVMNESGDKLGVSLNALVEALGLFPGEVEEMWRSLNIDDKTALIKANREKGVNDAYEKMTPSQRAAAQRFNQVGQNKRGPMTYDQFLNNTYIGPQGIMYPGAGGNRNSRPDINQRGKNSGALGDTGPKLVQGLDKVASLLEQNLALLQVA